MYTPVYIYLYTGLYHDMLIVLCWYIFLSVSSGQAFWFTKERGTSGPMFGNVENFNGLGIVLDSFDNNGQVRFPATTIFPRENLTFSTWQYLWLTKNHYCYHRRKRTQCITKKGPCALWGGEDVLSFTKERNGMVLVEIPHPKLWYLLHRVNVLNDYANYFLCFPTFLASFTHLNVTGRNLSNFESSEFFSDGPTHLTMFYTKIFDIS